MAEKAVETQEADSSKQKLLGEFSPPSYEQWRELVEKQLKGAPFEKKLVTKTAEEISLQPIYLREDGQAYTETLAAPGAFPFTRGTNATGNRLQGSQVGQEFYYPTAQEFNQAVRGDAARGLQSLSLILDEAGCRGLDPQDAAEGQVGKDGISIATLEDLQQALEGLDLSELSLQVRAGSAAIPFISLFSAYLQSKSLSASTLKGSLQLDPVMELAQQGELKQSLTAAYDGMKQLVTWSRKNASDFKVLGIDARPYAESGGSAVQELAFVTATAVTYIRALLERGLSIDEIAPCISFTFSMGPDFFMEISKFRAARSLWAQVIDAFGGNETSQQLHLQASNASWNKTIHDPYVNMLRTTTETLSGVIGGCDSISVSPFDSLMGLPNDFSRRIARNTQIVIQEESHVDKVIDPAGGSWFIENLTDELATKAWGLFQEVEQEGGILQALQKGKIQEQIVATAEQRSKQVGQRKQVIVGTNMYANLEEDLLESRLPDFTALKAQRSEQVTAYIKQRKTSVASLLEALSEAATTEKLEKATEAAGQGATLGELAKAIQSADQEIVQVTALKPHRNSTAYELLRKNAAAFQKKTGEAPKVFLANMGPLLQHKGRTDFVTDFLNPGGFTLISPVGFTSAADAAKAVIESGALVTVICSSDAAYPDFVPEFTKALQAANPEILIALAGYPKDQIEAFREAGVEVFIHIKSENLPLLNQFQAKAGV